MEVDFKVSKREGKYIIKFVKDFSKLRYGAKFTEKYIFKIDNSKKYKNIPWNRAFIASVRILIQENLTIRPKEEMRLFAKSYQGQFENDLKPIAFDTAKQAKAFLSDLMLSESTISKILDKKE